MKKKLLFFMFPLSIFAEIIELDKVEVNAQESTYTNQKDFIIEKEGFMRSAPMQKQITTKQALEIAGTNGDPIKALKSFAGVVSTNNDDGSELYIHGSKPRETAFTINHLPIGYLFHYGGMHSIIAPEMTGQIDAYLGGFDVSYEAMGAVIDITPKYPSGSNSGRVHIGMYDADFAYDAKLSENTNLFIGARRSYIDLIATKIMDEIEKDDDDASKKTTFTLFPQFYDAQLILSTILGDNALSLEVITAKDEMKINSTMEKDRDPIAVGKVNSKIDFTTLGGRWIYFGENFTSHTLLYHLIANQNLNLFDEDYFVKVKSSKSGIYHESVFNIKNHKPMIGFELINVKTPIKTRIVAPEFNDFEPIIVDREVVSLDKTFKAKVYTAFAQDIWSINDKNHFRYGVRAWDTQYQNFGGGVDPRFAYVYEMRDDLTLSAAVGRYSQFPQDLYVVEGFGNAKIKTYEFSDHYTLSFQKKFSDNSSLLVEPYFKSFENLAIADKVLKYKAVGEGEAYGVDITYRKQIKSFDIIASYTFVKAKRELNTDSTKQYRFEGDIPNTLQINTNYRFHNGWRVSGFLKYNDGAPYTPIIATEDYTHKGKNYKRPIYGKPYSKRLPSNIDLDIQIGKVVKYADNKSLEFSIELMNISSLLRKNVAGIEYDDNYEKDGEYHQMGFLPAFHVTYRF
jgi:hypothetical protein